MKTKKLTKKILSLIAAGAVILTSTGCSASSTATESTLHKETASLSSISGTAADETAQDSITGGSISGSLVSPTPISQTVSGTAIKSLDSKTNKKKKTATNNPHKINSTSDLSFRPTTCETKNCIYREAGKKKNRHLIQYFKDTGEQKILYRIFHKEWILGQNN